MATGEVMFIIRLAYNCADLFAEHNDDHDLYVGSIEGCQLGYWRLLTLYEKQWSDAK